MTAIEALLLSLRQVRHRHRYLASPVLEIELKQWRLKQASDDDILAVLQMSRVKNNGAGPVLSIRL